VVASKSVRKSLMTSNLNPASRTYVEDINREGIKTVMDRLNWPVSDAQLKIMHDQIDDKFFIRFFEMLSAAQTARAKTAYEVSQMMAEKATLMGTIVDTFEIESLEPCIDVLLRHEAEAGRMPDPPEELLSEGGELNVVYLGPLAQLQRTLLKTKGIIDASSAIAQLMAMDPSVGWKFNWLGMAEEVAVAQGLPQRHIVSDEEVAAIRQAQEQQAALAQQADVAEKAAKSAAALSKRVEPRSPLEQIMQSGAVAEGAPPGAGAV
jgi:hypothetical protein